MPQAIVGAAYAPVVRGFALATAAYYAVITLAHPFFEQRLALAILAPLSLTASAWAAGIWLWLKRETPGALRLELAALSLTACFFVNVATHLTLQFDPDMLVYFIFLALAAATTAPSQRVAYVSVAACIGGLLWFGRHTGPALFNKHMFIGLAGGFAAMGMATLMRGTVLREVRARVAAEALTIRAEAANRAKAAFLATISHEVRTPLNGVLGLAQAMARSPLVPAQRERLQLMQRSAESLLRTLNDVLDLSEIESGEMALQPADFRLDDLADSIRRLYGPLARERGLRFTVRTNFAMGELRHGDERKLLQVVSNLAANALKFTASGGVEVEISGAPEQVTCVVRDTGAGISREDQQRIFARFVQLDDTSTRAAGGAGLGLAICRELTRLMGGRISVSSTPGAGSSFVVSVPMPLANVTPATEVACVDPSGGIAGVRILVADDNFTNLTTMRLLLESLGAQVGAAADGRQALDAWRDERWDVVLMDIDMPVMDGVEATRAIREIELSEGRPRTPVIAVTASVLARDIDNYLRAGMDGAVAKPVDMNLLSERIVEAVRQRRASADQAAGVPRFERFAATG